MFLAISDFRGGLGASILQKIGTFVEQFFARGVLLGVDLRALALQRILILLKLL